MLKKVFFVIFYCIIILPCFAQIECNKEIYKSFIDNKMHLWEGQIQKMEQTYNQSRSFDCLYNLTYAQYGFIVYCIVSDHRHKGKQYLENAFKNVDLLLQLDSSVAELYSLKGALYGFKIEFNKIKAAEYGIISIGLINRAVDNDKTNPKVWMEKGNLTYYIPAFLGGGIKNAISFHKKAIYFFEQKPDELKYNWLYLLVMTNTARWYTENKQYNDAKLLYEKILKIEPGYLWVKKELYPDILKKVK